MILLTVAPKKSKHLRINLTKQTQELCAENQKMLTSEINFKRTKLLEILCSWIRKLGMVKMSVLSKLSSWVNTIRVKKPAISL